jgi:hypothetical protein
MSILEDGSSADSMEGDSATGDLSKGQAVVFFNGRRPMRGVIKDIIDNGNYVVTVNSNGGQIELVKPPEELKPFSAVKGKKARIRFL